METQFTIAACIVATEGTIRKCLAWRDPAFTPILDFGLVTDAVLVNHYLRRISEPGAPCKLLGVRMMLNDPALLDRLVIESPSSKLQTIVLGLPNQISSTAITAARKIAEQVFLEVYSADMVPRRDGLDPDGWVIRGNEAGGLCADTSNPTLLRRLREKISQPIWMFGGLGFQSALAYAIGGADGIVLSDALLLLPEVADDLKEHDLRAVKAAIRTQAVAIGHGLHVRISEAYPDLIERVRNLCLRHDRRPREAEAHVDTRLAETLAIMAQYPPTARCFLGEEVGWAAEWGQTFGSIADLAEALRRELAGQLEVLRTAYPFGQNSALARELKAEYPILQGPMTHVSDRPAFLAGVAQNGAIPFLAMGLSSADKLDPLLRETQAAVSGKPWGVGLIGFAPKALQDEQLARIRKYTPDLAIVAGGRPAHYKTLRDLGIIPFLHIPVPSMIANFFKEGVRHFIFEGRGCGGHVGPINSYPLWQSALIEFQKLAAAGEDLSAVRIALAGGIYDALSAAMAGAFCPPLLAHGVQFGVIVGTAYLFTPEIIASAAITPVFQEVALDSEHTVVIEGGIGHAIRCAPTPITEHFAGAKAALLGNGLAPQEVQTQLDQLNAGRLRLAAKGVMRAGRTPGDEALVAYSEANQVKEGLFMLGEVATLMDRTIGMADLHRALCGEAARVIAQTAPIAFSSRTAVRPAAAAKPTDMAIIGMASLLPGAENLDAFWRNVLAKIYCIQEVPDDRWRAAVNYHPDPNHKDTAYATKGGFLGEIPINCMEYGIPPGSMKNVEPAQLLALEAVKQALSDAGYAQREFDREKTSVIFGFAGGGDLLLAYSVRATLREYMARARDIPEKIREDVIASVNETLPEWSEDAFPGILGNVIAGRVANRFNLNGLNFTMDAACASSMAALQVACQELAYGSTNLAIVGGVDASQHPFGYTCFSKTKALSLSGQSKPFSPEADGIVLGEGVGVVVLKRLADALADHDRIYAVIKGIGGASDGKGSGMTVPVSRGQKLAIHRAYELAGFKTDSVDLIEAHGTGTPLGDRVELETIHEVLQHHGATQPCALGSIKAAIGHTKGAAGIIGVIKTALALHHKVLPAQANVETAHPAVSNPKTGLYLNTQNRPWFRRRAEQPRRAGASAFGFGGTNFHTVLEEFAEHAPAGADFPPALWPAELFFFGAQDAKTLVKRIEATLGLLSREDRPLARLALEHHKNQAPFTANPVRLAVRAEDLPQLKARLEQSKSLIAAGRLDADAGAAHPPLLMGEGLWAARRDAPAAPLTALFPGQGAQKPDMIKELALVFPIVRECLEQANTVLAHDFFPAAQGVLTDYIYPPAAPLGQAQKEALQALTQTTIAQPALAAVEMALYRLLLQFNVRIDLAAGHSFGELTALWAAGALNDRQLLTLAAKRGRCMAQSSEVATGMVAVQIQRAALEKHIEGVAELSIANHNAPKQVVVSGSISALETFETHCRQQKWSYKRLPVSQGFHSPYMASAEAHWRNALAEERFSTLTIPVFANLTAAPYGPTAPEIADTLGRHLRHGVNFVGEIEALHAAGSRTFLEIGPGATLTRFVDAILADKPHQAVAVQPREGQPGVRMLLDTLAALFVLGHDIDLQPAYAHRVIGPARPKPAASATLFLVNGGRARATVELRPKKETAPKRPRWEQEQPRVPVSGRPMPAPNPSPPAAEVPSAQPHPSGASALNDQEKLSKMKYFQQSMNLFLETQERFHQQRLAMMEKMWNINQQLLQGLLGSAPPAAMPAGRDAVTAFDPPNRSQDWPPSGQPGAPADLRPDPLPQAPEGVVAEVPQPSRPMEKRPQAASPDVPIDYQALLFDIISERTQYPVDMLAPEQQIEADLGIDSIKRVEIISMLQETHPSLGDIGNEKYFEEMAQLKTLGDIVHWIEAHFGATDAAPAAAGTAPQPAPATPKAGERVDYQALLFAVISERTQYPVDMLAPEQQIEADLGIDSIKRVEIISMLQETHPSLGDIGNEKYFEEMAQLKTLGDIVHWIEAHFGATDAAPAAAGTAPQPAPATPKAGERVDYQALLFAVISERTQYPVDMLAPEQQIEADLGIDSIKRVEIISMLQDTHPSLGDIGNEKYFEEMAQLKSLGDIVAWITQHFGAPSSTQAGVAALPRPDAPSEPEVVSRAIPEQYRPLVLAAISERTLYPVELIEMGMDLEEDLGIDPDLLKGLLRTLVDSHPSHEHRDPANLSEALGKLTTVQDLIHWVEEVFAQDNRSSAALPVATVTNQPPADQSVLHPVSHPVFHRYLLKLVPRPLDLSRPRNVDGVLLILDGGHGLGRQIQIIAQQMGVQCVRVVDEGGTAPEHASSIRMNFSEEQDYPRCYHHIKQSVGSPAGILNLLALGQKTHAAAYGAVLHSFLWAKTIGADPDLLPLSGRQLFWMSVSGMGGDFGLNPAMDFEACQNGVHGITKSLFHEWPGLQVKTIDIHPDGNLEQIARGVLDECHEVTATIKEVGLTGDGRHEMVLVDRPVDVVAPQARFSSAPVFLITGGAKGITADVAACLAQRYAPTLIVTGRTPLPERSPEDSEAFMARAARGAQDPKRFKSEIIDTLKATGEQVSPALVNGHFNAILQEYKARQNIARMAQLGAKVFYYACDCTDEPSFAGLLRQVYRRHHKIDGVIHAAGYLKDGLITQKSMAHFKRVLDTKVEGARILIRELDFQNLDFIVFFSSVSGRFGNQGQADYAAANEILNKMAVKIDMRWPGKATAINWGPWEGEGMVSSQVKKQFDEAGVFLLPRDVGAHMLNLEILQSDRSPEVIIFGAKDIDRRLPVLQVPEASAPLPFVELFEPLAPARSDPPDTAWQLTLDQTAPYLSDHRINGTPVLPAAVAMEIMAQAAMAAQPGYRFKAIHDFKLIKGITLGPQGPVKLRVTARKSMNATRKSALIEVRLAMPDQAERCNYSASILLTREQNGNGHIPYLTPGTHSQRFDQPVEAVYAERLFHTGVFRALRTIESYEIADLQNNGIRGSLHTSSPQRILGTPTKGAWLLDPIVFDGAYQLSLLWIQECYDLMALPSDIKKYVQYRPYNGGPIRCDIAVKTAHFPRLILDFNFSDEGGRLYAKATDVAAIMKKDLNRTRRGPIEKETAASA